MKIVTEEELLGATPEELEGALEARQRRSFRSDNGHENHETNADKEEGGPRSVFFDRNQERVWDHEDYCNAFFGVKASLQLGLKKDIEAKDPDFSEQTNGINAKIVDQLVSENLQNGKAVLGAEELNGLSEFSVEHGTSADPDFSEQTNGINAKIVDQLVSENLQNGKAVLGAEELNGLSEFSVEREGQNTKKETVNQISISHLHSETDNGSTRLSTEIEVHSEVRLAEKSKLQVTEIDVERILDEQDTHDLYCPNCHSCITKRVILRKRKRIINEFKYEAKREKVDEAQHRLDVGSSLGDVTDEGHDREPEENRVTQDSQQLPAKATRWSSFIDAVRGKKKVNEIGTPLLAKSAISSGIQVEDSSKGIERTQTDSMSESMIIADSAAGNKEKPGVLAKINDGGKIISIMSAGEQMVISNKGKPYSPSTLVSGAQVPREVETIRGKDNDTGKPGKIISIMSVGEQIFPSTSVPGAQVPGEAETVRGKDNDIGKPGTIISIESVGEQMEISNKGKPYSPSISVTGTQMPGEAETMRGKDNDIIDRNESGFDVITRMADAITLPISQVPPVVVEPQADSRIVIGDEGIRQDTRRNELEILKCIVYGGLLESIASLGIVSSAAGAETSTLNIVAIGMANLIGGLLVIVHDLFELRGDQHGIGDRKEEPSGRYWEQLGRKTNFRLHATVALLSYIIFGLLPPVIYGFSFRKSNNKEYKLIAVAAASLLCIALLAIGKAHARQQKDYLKCLSYYIGLGVSASGLAYVAGTMINSLMVELGLFEPGADAPAPPSVGFIENGSKMPLWSSF